MEVQIAHPELCDCTSYDKGLHLVSAGYYSLDTKDVCRVRPDGREDYFMFYVHKGKSRYVMNGEVRFALAGDIVFYNFKDVQDYTHLSEFNTEIFWVHFKGDMAQSFLGDLQFTKSMSVHTEENLSVYFKAIIHALTYKKPHYLKTAAHNLISVLLKVSHCIAENASGNEKFDYIISLMNNPEHNKMSLSEYAEMCSLCPSQFIRKFTMYTGQTPIRYKNEIVMKKAKWYLAYTNYTVGEIAELLHIENVYYFSNLFKKHTGTSPTKYRETSAVDNRSENRGG